MANYETQTIVAFAATTAEAEELVELLSDHGIDVKIDRDYDGPGSEAGFAMVVEEDFEEEARGVIAEHSGLNVFASSIESDDEVIDVDESEDDLLGTELDSTGQFLDDDGVPAVKEVAGLEESVSEEDVAEEEAPDFIKVLFGGEGLGDDDDEFDDLKKKFKEAGKDDEDEGDDGLDDLDGPDLADLAGLDDLAGIDDLGKDDK